MRCLFYVFVMMVVTGCCYSEGQSRELDEAVMLMSNDPAAALSRLNSVDVSELRDSATIARWALLYSEAMVINRQSAPTDTIVNIAVDYYGDHNLTAEFEKAVKLKALIQRGDSSNALAMALYTQKEKEFMLYKERTERRSYMFVGLVILLIAGGVIVWMRQRMKLQKIQSDALMAEASCLKAQLADGRSIVSSLQSTLYGLLDSRFTLIDSLCQTYYETQGTPAEKKAVSEKIKKEIDGIRTDSFAELEKCVNACRNNILSAVKEEFPEIKTDDYRLLVYLACGFSTRAISLLVCESVEVVYKRKSRLKSRLAAVGKPSCMQVLQVF